MSRNIDVYAMVKGEPVWLSGMIARALGMSQAKDESLKVSGCGMDMGFHIVYSVSTFLRNEYKCTGERCPASIHVNEHTPRDGKAMHKDGYAISQRWL